jgi:hypothetical protein
MGLWGGWGLDRIAPRLGTHSLHCPIAIKGPSSGSILGRVFPDFHHNGQRYDLQHLRSYTITYERPVQGKNPAESFSVNVTFSHHCFTEGLPKNEAPHDPALRYDFNGDPRLFNVRRWALSRQLPDIIAKLPTLRCAQTGKGNFFTVALTDADGATVDYEIYFRIWKPGKGRIFMHVESAYVREADYGSSRPKGMSIAFFVILHNIRHGRPIHG